jgi:hypothetical protein
MGNWSRNGAEGSKERVEIVFIPSCRIDGLKADILSFIHAQIAKNARPGTVLFQFQPHCLRNALDGTVFGHRII